MRIELRAFTAALTALTLTGAAPQDDRWAAERSAMVRDIEHKAAIAPGGVRFDARVLAALRATPRHRFVPAALQADAYADTPLPIGHEATISQPFMVAVMTQLARPRPGDVVLEVGTGSGYQAAVLSPLVARVYTIEIVPALAESAAARLRTLAYRNVVVRQGDGYAGWPEHGPFDAIVVTAGATHLPQPLLSQLSSGGRMVIPVGPRGDQQLVVVDKGADGRIRQRTVMPVRFVPLRERPRERRR